jgi:SAM-dependent methyltransferase
VSERADGKRFDREHGVTTEALFFLGELDDERIDEARSHATHYEPVPAAAFAALLALVPAEAIASSTFVDVGSGMGRAVLLASEYPFRCIVGIELAASLHAIALENLESATRFDMRCRDIRLVRADARRYRYPRGPLVVFLYNPFDGEALEDVCARIQARAHSAADWIVYHTPVHADVLLARGYEEVARINEGAVYRRSRVSEHAAIALREDIE